MFRKLYQDVAAFRRYLATAAKSLYGSDDEYHQELVAAKMMGRWRSGCPLDLSPDKDDPEIAADPERRNDFTYAATTRVCAVLSARTCVAATRGRHRWYATPRCGGTGWFGAASNTARCSRTARSRTMASIAA